MDNNPPPGTPSGLHGMEEFFDLYLHRKAPFQLPAKAKEAIVAYGPWISLVLLILGAIVIIPLTFLAIGLTTITLPFAAYAGVAHSSFLWTLHLIIGVLVLVLEGLAIPGLLKRRLSGWHLLYYAMLLSALGSLLAYDIVGLILGLIIGMYILFQIREYYK